MQKLITWLIMTLGIISTTKVEGQNLKVIYDGEKIMSWSSENYEDLPAEYDAITDEWYNLTYQERIELLHTLVRDMHYSVIDSGRDWFDCIPEEESEDPDLYLTIALHADGTINFNKVDVDVYDLICLLHNHRIAEDYDSGLYWY